MRGGRCPEPSGSALERTAGVAALADYWRACATAELDPSAVGEPDRGRADPVSVVVGDGALPAVRPVALHRRERAASRAAHELVFPLVSGVACGRAATDTQRPPGRT